MISTRSVNVSRPTYDNAQNMYVFETKSAVSLSLSSLDMANGLFKAVDKNGNDSFDFTDLMGLSAMVNKLTGNNSQQITNIS